VITLIVVELAILEVLIAILGFLAYMQAGLKTVPKKSLFTTSYP